MAFDTAGPTAPTDNPIAEVSSKCPVTNSQVCVGFRGVTAGVRHRDFDTGLSLRYRPKLPSYPVAWNLPQSGDTQT